MCFYIVYHFFNVYETTISVVAPMEQNAAECSRMQRNGAEWSSVTNGGYLEKRATVAALGPRASIQTCSMVTQDTGATGNRYRSVVECLYIVSDKFVEVDRWKIFRVWGITFF